MQSSALAYRIVVRNKEKNENRERERTFFLMHIHVQVSPYERIHSMEKRDSVHGCEPPRDSPIKQASVIHTDSDAKRKIDEINFVYIFFFLYNRQIVVGELMCFGRVEPVRSL